MQTDDYARLYTLARFFTLAFRTNTKSNPHSPENEVAGRAQSIAEALQQRADCVMELNESHRESGSRC